MPIPNSHTLQSLVDAGWAPSVRFLQTRLRRGLIRGRKVDRQWRLTDDDVAAYLESIANTPTPVRDDTDGVPVLRLAAGSARRRAVR